MIELSLSYDEIGVIRFTLEFEIRRRKENIARTRELAEHLSAEDVEVDIAWQVDRMAEAQRALIATQSGTVARALAALR